jgi:hypothetical protein
MARPEITGKACPDSPHSSGAVTARSPRDSPTKARRKPPLRRRHAAETGTASRSEQASGYDDDARISQPEVARLLGNISPMTLWRWRDNAALNFPKPVLEVNGRRYFRRADILAWRPPARTKKRARKSASRD